MNIFELFGSIAIKNKDANEALKDTTQKAERAGKQIQDAFKKIGSATVKAAKFVGGAVATVTAAFTATVKGTREYREAMAKLDTAFVTNGHSAETAKNTYKALQAVLGETDQAVEAANHLAVMCDNAEDLATWTDICTGVYATFGDSLPIEGLTESANETAKVGQVTGSLADALNWAGINEDEFNLRLKACRTEQERQQLIMTALNNTYKDAAAKYKENAASVMRANAAQEKLNSALAKIGEIGEPILSGLKSWIADMVNAAAPHLETLVTKFQNVGSVWNDVIWPLVQSAVKITIGYDLPDWETLKSDLTTKWTNDIWPGIQDKLKAKLGIELGDWDTVLSGALGSVQTFATDTTNALRGILDWATGDGKGLLTFIGTLSVGIFLLTNPVFVLSALVAALVLNWNDVKKAVDDTFNAVTGWLTSNVGASLETFRENIIVPLADYWNTTVKGAIGGAAQAVGDFFGIDLIEGWDSVTSAIAGAWNSVTSAIASAATAVDSFLGNNGNNAPWYVKQNPSKYSVYGGGFKGGSSTGNSFGRTFGTDGSHASGLDYVHRDGYIARVHKGEAILNSAEANEWRGGGSGKVEALLSQLVNIMSAGQMIRFDNGVLAGQLMPAMDTAMGAKAKYKGRGN